MAIEKLGSERLSAFLAFCRAHRTDVDDSFLYDEDLRKFVPSDEDPTYLALADGGRIVGAASLMNSAYYRRGRKGRFRIFFVQDADPALYEDLLGRITQDSTGLDGLYVFVSADNGAMAEILHALHFEIERSACVMLREPCPVEDPVWEDGYLLRTLVFNRDEDDYCYVRNLGFANLKGSDTPLAPSEVSRLEAGDDYIPGGILLLVTKENRSAWCGPQGMSITKRRSSASDRWRWYRRSADSA